MKACTVRTYVSSITIALVGCSGGGSSPAPPQNPSSQNPSSAAAVAGYWRGPITHPFSSSLGTATLFAEETGEFQLHVSPLPPDPPSGLLIVFGTPPFIIFGNACCQSQVNVSAVVKNWDQSTQTPLQLSLNLQASTLSGGFDYEGRRFSFDLPRADTNPTRLTLADLASVYAGTYASYIDTPKGWTLTIQATGTVTGSDVYGCTWTGTASVANPTRNVFRLRLTAAGCSAVRLAPVDGEYTGLGILVTNRPASGVRYPGQDVIDFNLVGPIWFGQQMLAR